jgi:hypothetical protein
MAEPIFMRIGEGKSIDLAEFHRTTGHFLGLLQEFDSAVAKTSAGFLNWIVTSLQASPSPIVGVTPSVRRRARHALDISGWVEKELITGIGTLNEGKERPRIFSDAALTRLHVIAKTAPIIGDSQIYTGASESIKLHTSISVKTFNQVEELTIPRSISFGTVLGSLETISVHKGLEFRVWEEESRRPVRCIVTDSRLRTRALNSLGAKVVVSGNIKADRYGRPISMVVENFDPIQVPDNLPSIAEMKGLVPDFTGGASLREFLEDLD